VERDTGNVYLTPEAVDTSDDDPSNQLLGSSITYRIAVGSQQGRKVFTLRTLPSLESDNQFSGSVGEVAGFSPLSGRLSTLIEVSVISGENQCGEALDQSKIVNSGTSSIGITRIHLTITVTVD